VPIEIAFGVVAILFLRRVAWTWIAMLWVTVSGVLVFLLWGASGSILLLDQETFRLLGFHESFQHVALAILEISEAVSSLVIALSMRYFRPVRMWFHAVGSAQ